MIGQEELLKNMSELLTENKFPRTSILVGEEGSGKKTLCHELCKQVNWIPIYIGTKVDEIREMIKNAYTVVSKTLYIIPNADKMSVNAANALLKVLEEPPNNAYFILLYDDLFSVLKTIKSRSTIFMLAPYSKEELKIYLENITSYTDGWKYEKWSEILVDFCDNPGELQIVTRYDIEEFYNYTKKVVDHISNVSSANCFKIADKVAIKADDEGYDLKLFWKLFMYICLDTIKTESEKMLKYALAISITSRYVQDLRLKGANRQTLIDMWILDIRKAWM